MYPAIADRYRRAKGCAGAKTFAPPRPPRFHTGKMPRVITLHSIRVRVYYEDTDAGGIVYYANYLRFFERARTDWLRAAGISHQEMAQVEGLNLVVRDCAVQYLRPARLDDLLTVEVGLANPETDVGRASLRFSQRAVLVDQGAASAAAGGAETVLATGTVRVACMDRISGKPVALPRRVTRMISTQVSEQVSMQTSTSVPQQVFITPDGTAEQQ
jgi:acyl-CoA thioester hydrolase